MVVVGPLAAQTQLVVTPVGPPSIRFDPAKDACDGHDVPDAPLRAFRAVDGSIVAFGLHFENRRMTGPSLEALKVECGIVFRGAGSPNPGEYDDRAWIAATWSRDGSSIHALVHHEFQAHRHPGRCTFPDYIKCWWNAIFAVQSRDGGRSFVRPPLPVVAAGPGRSEDDQGRHRGFFNPSNIIEGTGPDLGRHFTLIATTGGINQPSGACLFRTTNIAVAERWRAHDGGGYLATFPDPYDPKSRKRGACKPVGPFPGPVGSLSRHASGLHVAIFQVAAGMPDNAGGTYAKSGFYSSSSRDLLKWSAPQLVLESPTLYDDPCGKGTVRAYPSLLDPAAKTRNFEDVGTEGLLFFSELRVEGCTVTSDRKLIARKVRIAAI